MQYHKYKKIVAVILVVFMCTTSFFTGVYAAQKKGVTVPTKVNAKIVEPVSAKNTDLNLFFNVWNTLRSKSIYYNESNDASKVYGAIEGLTASLGDPYTEFMDPKTTKDFNESIQGSFDGIGAEVGLKEGILTVIAPLKDSPAEKSGLKAGDKIIKIDNVMATSYTINDAISHIRGPKGTTVNLEIYREGEFESKVVPVVRDKIVVKTLKTEIKNDVFIIHFYNFGEKAIDDFKSALKEYKDSGLSKIIIDLRGNPGGYLNAAVEIGSYFVPKGKTIVSEDFTKQGTKQIHTSYGYDYLPKNTKTVVLIDGSSASASEILAGALRDNGVAKLVGVKSYGKGSVQELIPMPQNTSLKVTIAKWLTPNGITIDKNGINPDIEIKRIIDSKDTAKDNQLDKALEIINQN